MGSLFFENLKISLSADKRKSLFVEFELVVLGEWFGKTQNNGRHKGPENGNIGIFYTMLMR